MKNPAALAGALALFAAGAACADKPAGDAQEVRTIMGEVFEAMQRALPASLDQGRFADPAQRAELREALDTLARHAEQLAAHGSGRERGFAFLSRSLARDAREVRRRFDEGSFREAAFWLQELTEDCVACHSRLPSAADPGLSERFLEEVEIQALPLPARARLAMATRQFEAALSAHEAMLASPEYAAASLDLEGYLHDYLEVCLRVRRDFDRAATALEGFAARPDLSPSLRRDVAGWIADLLDPGLRRAEGLAGARGLIEPLERQVPKPSERALLARYLVASGALHRFLESRPADPAREAEASYWMGVVESRVGRAFWLSQAELYLEGAVRLDPGGPFAEPAYALLEEFVISGYSGSAGTHVPPEVQERLEELARMIDSARPGRPGAPSW